MKGFFVTIATAMLYSLLGIAGPLFGWMFSESLYAEFLRNLILLILGLPLGLKLNRMWERHQSQERRQQLLRALRSSLSMNLEHLDASVEEMQRDVASLPETPVDLITLDATAAIRYELLDVELARTIDAAHFGLRHVGHLMLLLHEHHPSTSYKCDKAQISALGSRLAEHPETLPISQVITQRLTQRERHGIRSADVRTGWRKQRLFAVIFGHSTGAPGDEQRYPLSLGGVHNLCMSAIDAIEDSLHEHSSAGSLRRR